MSWDDGKPMSAAKDQGPSAAPAGAIDLEHLARYTLGNRSLQEEVLGLFRGQSETYLQHLQDAGDAKAWADAAHTLKGSARSVGAMAVAQHAELAEALTGNPGSENHQTALQELAELIGAANRFIDRELADPSQDT